MTFPTIQMNLWNGASYTDVIGDTTHMVIKRGKQKLLERHTTSTLELTLDTTQSTWDPTAAGALFGIDTEAYVDVAGFTLFAGTVSSYEVSYDSDDTANIRFLLTGSFKNLTGVTFPYSSFFFYPSTNADTVLDAIVSTAIGGGGGLGTWVMSQDGAGGLVKTITATGDTLSALQAIAESVGGEFTEEMTNGQPMYRFIDKTRQFKGPSYTFTDVSPSPPTSYPYNERDLTSRATDDFIRNYVLVTPIDGSAAQVASDATSIASHYQREHSVTTYLPNGGDAQALAGYLKDQFKEAPAVSWDYLLLEPDAEDDTNLWTFVEKLGYEALVSWGCRFNDRIKVVRTNPWGTVTRECVVQGFEHDIRPMAQGTWTTKLYITDAESSKDGFILDSATDGILDTNKLV